ncbi:hypothetical protein PRK78_002842 [Emydomyces testavorans]|uniref:GH16 domain-containing protein n=1 Tax=Emydomyces testavorans TaxID=2070801 RepID=A0AAF0DF22_9EURO|nr:hypothetical protein PRK78_002842 [Emydomyces testavorans]
MKGYLACISLLGVFLGSLPALADLRKSSFSGNDTTARVKQNNAEPQCDCYVVSGPEPGYFQHYRFFDFRSVPPKEGFEGKKRKHGRKKDRKLKKQPNGLYSLEGHPFSQEWNIQSWSRAGSSNFPLDIVNSVDNVYVTKNNAGSSGESTHLVMRLTRYEDYTSAAEFQTATEDILRCSLRVRLRLYSEDDSGKILPPQPGAVAGIFTYHSETSESDIEILTIDPPTRVHYANQPDWDSTTGEMIPGASDELDVDFPWTEWSEHRLDWFPTQSRWYLNDDLVLEKGYRVPNSPSVIVLNLWSGGGDWSGNMTVGSSVYMGIEWIEVAYNTSGWDFEETNDAHAFSRGSGKRWRERFDIESWKRRWYHKFNKGKGKMGETEGAGDNDDDHDHNHDLDRDTDRDRVGEDDSDYDEDSDREDDEDDFELADRGACSVVCRIDDVDTVGVPEVVWDATRKRR